MKPILFNLVGLLVFLAISGASLSAQTAPASDQPVQVAVWPKLAPGETTANPGHLGDVSGNVLRMTDVTAAQLFIYPLPNHPKAPAVMVCPGGSYSILATDLEGSEIAHWLNKLGYVAAVLDYRVPDKREGALQDAQRALSLLRAKAQDYGLDPTHLGIIGFSAGGHLSARVSVTGTKRAYAPIDAIDEQSCRPDFTLLVYPAYLIDKGTGQPAPEVMPVASMPPLFMAQSKDDVCLCMPAYAATLTQLKIPFTEHLYETGGHGYGLRAPATSPVSQWPTDAAAWLQQVAPATK